MLIVAVAIVLAAALFVAAGSCAAPEVTLRTVIEQMLRDIWHGLKSAATRPHRKAGAMPIGDWPAMPCLHLTAVPVVLSLTGEVVAQLCPACDRQLPATFVPAPHRVEEAWRRGL